MKKIINLYRLNFNNQKKIVVYLFKKLLRLQISKNEQIINEYYFHLISHDGFLINENENYFVAHYKDINLKIKLRKRPSSDLNVFAQIFKYNEYKPLVDCFKDNFSNESKLNIIDAGSNIGLTSVYLNTFFPNSKFIVIEPDSSNFETMSFNLKENKVHNVVKVKGGIWSKNTNLKIISDFRDQKDWSFRVEESNDDNGLEAYSFNYLFKKNSIETIDILKIDIEGSEKEVFLSEFSNLSYLKKTKCIAIEIHDEFDCRTDIYKILKEYNFEYFESGELTIGVNQNFK
jgi:FkbM family methyltransferase